ncbi:MAG: sodium ion-translocating decarboxylase subunit beta, partial [Victivallales bacterium]|nr:sodium ion-translocating decarboxylase subunit beta [Victivallales bacterium]
MKKLLGSILIAVFALTIGTVHATEDDWEAPPAPERVKKPEVGGVQQLVNNSIYKVEQGADGVCTVRYVWVGEATVEQISTEKGKNIQPGRPLVILNIHPVEGYPELTRSKAHIEAGVAAKVINVPIHEGQHIYDGDVLFTFQPAVLLDDSVLPSDNADMSFSAMLKQLWQSTGIYEFIVRTGEDWTLGIGRLLMICVGFVLLYLAIFKGFEPLLLVPIGYGAIMSNIPLAGIATPDGILGILFKGVDFGIYPLLIFLGIGAMTDFAPLIANPWTALLGAAAQLGIFGA